MRDTICDNYALKNSKIGAREYWMIHKGDATKGKRSSSKKVYLDYNRAKQDVIELCFLTPDESFYILKCIEVFRNVDGALKAEIIEKIK
jgi:hypothetical protein